MKKFAFFMATVLFILSVLTGTVLAADDVFTSAYTPASVTNTTEKMPVVHVLTLTEAPYTLGYTITYTFTVGDAEVYEPNGQLDPTKVINGSPSIETISYGPSDFTGSPYKETTLNISWQGVTFSEPGIYYWPVTKDGSITNGAPKDPSNDWEDTYLMAYVINDPTTGNLAVKRVGLSTSNAFTEKVEEIDDEYPAALVDLTVTKTVSGNQGSKDQYFKFDISIVPAGGGTIGYTISGYDQQPVVRQSPYSNSKNAEQPDRPTGMFTGGSQKVITVWLKDGDKFKINPIPYGSSYTITETEVAGYDTATYNVTGDTLDDRTSQSIVSGENFSVGDSSLTTKTYVVFNNNKEDTPPTGIDLESSAPVIGLILAAGLLAMVFVPVRRKENN